MNPSYATYESIFPMMTYLEENHVYTEAMSKMLRELIFMARFTRENLNIPMAIQTLLFDIYQDPKTACEDYISRVGDSATVTIVQKFLITL